MSGAGDYWPNAKWASVKANGIVVALSTCSGFRSTALDPKGHCHVSVTSDMTCRWLGVSLLQCLAVSRILDTEEKRDELFELENLKRSYESYVANIMKCAGVNKRRTFFREMHSCAVTLADGTITVEPKRHEKLEAWSALADREGNRVRVAASEPPEVIGAAVIEALKRCWPPYPWQKEL